MMRSFNHMYVIKNLDHVAPKKEGQSIVIIYMFSIYVFRKLQNFSDKMTGIQNVCSAVNPAGVYGYSSVITKTDFI